MKKTIKNLLFFMLASVFVVTTACSSSNNEANPSAGARPSTGSGDSNPSVGSDLPWLEYTVATNNETAAKWANNPNDVVTPYIENKFKIKVKDVIVTKDEDFNQRLNQWIASDTVPDVIITGNGDLAQASGQFANLDDYFGDMTNYNRYFDQKYWPRFMNDDHHYQIPTVTLNLNDPKYADDPWNTGYDAWALWAREDILAKAGYTFTPIADIQKNIADQGKRPTHDDYKIEPPINTPEDFYAMLKKIKDLNLEIGGKPVIPLSITSWQQFHIGTMFDWGHWRMDDDGNVDSYLGTPGAKPYYQFLNKLYSEGLIDKDFIIQKDEQLQEKAASGRVAVGMFVPDLSAAMSTLQQSNPDAAIRYIPWPKETPGKGFFDIYQGGGWRILIKKDFKDIKRLLAYFDWFYSDEGLETITWGPESAGLWEMKDGKKVFKDKELEQAALSGVHDQKGADYYGLYDWNSPQAPFWSKAAMSTPIMTIGNPKSYLRSYPPKLDALLINKGLEGKAGVDYSGKVAANDSKENSLATSTFFWSKFQSAAVAKLLLAKSDADFDKAWNDIYAAFLKDGKYEQAKADMKAWFEKYGAK